MQDCSVPNLKYIFMPFFTKFRNCPHVTNVHSYGYVTGGRQIQR